MNLFTEAMKKRFPNDHTLLHKPIPMLKTLGPLPLHGIHYIIFLEMYIKSLVRPISATFQCQACKVKLI